MVEEEEKNLFGGIEKGERKERKKERKKKEKRRFPTLLEVGFLSYLGYHCLGVIQWPWSLILTLRLVNNSLEQIV